jgi:hypothetical protein
MRHGKVTGIKVMEPLSADAPRMGRVSGGREMNVGLRFYRDGPVFKFATQRIETMFLPQLIRMPGYRWCRMLSFSCPVGGGGGIGMVAFDTPAQLDDANRAATEWAAYHLQDLQAELTPSEQFRARILLAHGGPLG